MKPRALAVVALVSITATIGAARAEPDNDSFASAAPIGPGPVVETVSTSGASTEPGEPVWCGGASDFLNATIWFRYVPTVTERITVRTLQTTSSFGHLLSVYTGPDVANVALVACRDGDTIARGATVDLVADAGTSYMIQLAASASITAGLRLVVLPSSAGDIAGRVADTSSAPIAGICVRASAITSSFSGTTETRPDGRYVLSVPGGAYVVRFFDCRTLGYNDVTVGRETLAVVGEIVVRPGARTDGVDATLQRFGSIAGRITAPGGDPIWFACVFRLSEEGSLTEWPVATKPDGRYELKEVLPGAYRIKFADCRERARFVSEWYDDQPTWRTAAPVAVAEGVVVTGIDAELTPVS